MRSTAVAVLAVGALLLAAVPAAADHAYSHRYIVYGRVVDDAGMPIEGVQVNVDMSPFDDYEGPCPQEGSGGTDRQQTTTDATGRYYFCAHVHSTGSSQHQFTVDIGSQEKTVTSDPDLRRSHVNFQLDQARPDIRGDTDAFNNSYRIRGIIWQEEDTSIARIGVNGVALTYEPVDATLTTEDGTTYEGDFVNSPFNTPRYNPRLQQTRDNVTDQYGDFIFTWSDIPQDISGATVTVTSEDRSTSHDVDTTYRHSTAALIVPGEGLNLGFLWILGGLIVLGVGGYLAYEPVKDRWEDRKRQRRMERLEEESDRKRS